MAEATFTAILGNDDFLVNEAGKKLWQQKTADLTDDFSQEILEGHCAKVEDVSNVVSEFCQSAQTLSMFGEKVIWIKGANFLADSVTGRAEGTQKELERLKEELSQIDPHSVQVILTATPVDRRKSFPKWCQKNAQYTFIDSGDKDPQALQALVQKRCQELSVNIAPGAGEILVAKVGGNTRLVHEELRKLATYLGPADSTITEALIMDLVPNFGEGDFFEVVEAFYALDLPWTLDAIRRHFFTSASARPLITSLQGRNRLLIQMKTLLDKGMISIGPRGINKSQLDSAGQHFADLFPDLSEKSNFNLFSQNPWYLGRLAQNISKLSLKKLIDWQQAFIDSFTDILNRPQEEETVMRELAIRTLSK